ncbi:methyltransferase domain-containing protein [Pseudonocardiaceae bacterium YIM PH 21723]|nr:methyltransferase domain-containing protein [Pseudonocardiaceae bacterium YIM PH 21723]
MTGAEPILRLAFAFPGSRTLLSATELGLFTALADGGLDCEQLRERLGVHPRGARDFFDTLVALGMLEREDGVYRNTPETARYLDRNSPDYLGGVLELTSIWIFQDWAGLTESLRTGEPRTAGPDLFDELYADPVMTRRFQRAMTHFSLPAIRAIIERYPWAGVTSVADIGCSEGAFLRELADRYPQMRRIGFDREQVRGSFEDYVGERAEFQAGDFLTGPLPSAEVLVFGHILHDWDLDTKQMLLAKAYEALPPGGEIILYESLIDDERRQNAWALVMSLSMLLHTPGGFDYTGADARDWLTEAGFRDVRVERLTPEESMVVATKP